eukprot:11057619-Lingulodinium_polyedra.AAC.1
MALLIAGNRKHGPVSLPVGLRGDRDAYAETLPPLQKMRFDVSEVALISVEIPGASLQPQVALLATT